MKPLEIRHLVELWKLFGILLWNFVDYLDQRDDTTPIGTPNRFGLDDTGRILPVNTATKYRIDFTYEGDGQSGSSHYYSNYIPTSTRGVQRIVRRQYRDYPLSLPSTLPVTQFFVWTYYNQR